MVKSLKEVMPTLEELFGKWLLELFDLAKCLMPTSLKKEKKAKSLNKQLLPLPINFLEQYLCC